MINTPLVSVLVTAYNRENFIAEAIESVIKSTFSDWELIVVDDCSSDNTFAIAKEYEKKDSRIRVYLNEKNLGDYPNRNKAASYAKGKYLKYVDSDDMLLVHGLQVMVESIEKFPEAGIAMMWNYGGSFKEPIITSPEAALREYFINNRWLMVAPTASIYLASVFFELGGFSGKNYIGDFEFNIKSASKYPSVKMRNDLIFYRIHDQQQVLEAGHNECYRVYLYKIQKETLEGAGCPLNEADKITAFKKINKLQARRALFYYFKSFDFKGTIKMITESTLGWKRFIKGLVTF